MPLQPGRAQTRWQDSILLHSAVCAAGRGGLGRQQPACLLWAPHSHPGLGLPLQGLEAAWRLLYLQALDCNKTDAVWEAEMSPALRDRKTPSCWKAKETQHQEKAHTCYINNVKSTYTENNMKAAQGRPMSRNVISSVPKANQPSSGQARNILDYDYACGWWKV